MANPSKSKGTKFENELLEDLRQVWPAADRAKANNPSDDFTGIPFPVEAKHRKAWAIRDWTRKLQQLSPGRWLLCVADGDRRLTTSAPDFVVLPRPFAMELLRHKYGEQQALDLHLVDL